MGKELEMRSVTGPQVFMAELADQIEARRDPERKYTSQVGLKDVGFAVDEEKQQILQVKFPFEDGTQTEQGLRAGIITPTTFLENDGTEHHVAVFDPEPVGHSGFADCVTHSLSLTDQGLFEVGRYPAMSVETQHRYWQWFLHRRLVTPDRVQAWEESYRLSPRQVVDMTFETLAGRKSTSPSPDSVL